MRLILSPASVCLALSVLAVPVTSRAGTNLVFNGSQASGANWSQAIWKTNNGAGVGVGTAVAPVAGNTYTLRSNAVAIGNNLGEARVRCPTVTFLTNFPGDSLTLITNTEIRFKTAAGLICGFPGVGGNPGLILQGGMLNAGDDAIFTINGKVQAAPGTTSYICSGNNDGANAVVARAFTVNAQLLGSGTICIFEAYTNNPQKFAGSNNTFSGNWLVKAGLLQGATQDALGTNSSFTLDPQYTLPIPPFATNQPPILDVPGPAVLEALYNINSAGTLTLTNGGKMRLHGEAVFTGVTIEGTALSSGTHFFPELSSNFPNNFDAGGSGAIVVQPYGTPPPLPPTILVQPRPQQVFAGDTARFTLSVADNGFPPLTYHWRRDGTNLTDVGNISGSTNLVLAVKNVSAADLANYDVVVANASSSVTSSITTMTIVSTSGETYETAVLAANPIAFYELNETTDPSSGTAQAFDPVGGYAGLYGTAVQNGFTPIAGPGTADGFPGFAAGNYAASFAQGGLNENISALPWNLNTNNVTITAWINPAGTEFFTNGLVVSRGGLTVAGLAYNHDGTLGYIWNNEQPTYNWSSGLTPPSGQWSFVSLVVTPTNATIYVMNTNTGGLQASTHVYNHVKQGFEGSALIGGDSADGGNGNRSFNGVIDDVGVFNQALSQSQLLNLFSAASGIANFPPSIAIAPASTNLYQAQTAQFTGLAVGSAPLTYQWQAGATGGGVYTNLTDGGQFSGSATPTLTVSSLDFPNAADYVVWVTNLYGVATSAPPATLTVVATNPPQNITLTNQQAAGLDWDTANAITSWQDGNGATTSAASEPGSTYEMLPGSRLRTPLNPISATFPGNVLTVDGDGVWNLNPAAGATIAEIRFKQPTYGLSQGAVNFAKLRMNGGQLDVGADSAGGINTVIIGGEIDILTNTPFNNDSGTDRGYLINAQLTGSSSIEYHGYNQTGFMSTYSNNLNIACTSNTFSGFWNIVTGTLLGTGTNSLGTNSIVIGTNAALQTTYNIRSSNAVLVLSGKMYLNQDDVFKSALINGKSLAPGNYTAVTLYNTYPNNFLPNWNPQNGAANFITASGSLTVLSNSGPVILSHPASVTLWGQQNATFTVNAIGDLPLAYQWRSGAIGSGTYTNVPNGGNNVSGAATNATLNITNVTAANGLDYVVVVTNQYGSIQSRPATLIIRPGPTITAQPQSLTLYEQQTAQFSVSTLGLLPLSYQWQAAAPFSGGPYTNLTDGGQFSGCLTPNLTVANLGQQNNADYIVVVSNAGGSTNSTLANLTVTPLIDAGGDTITLNGSSISPLGAGVPVQEPTGADWDLGANTLGGNTNWSDMNPASISAWGKPGSTFVVVPGSRLRPPAAITNNVFPGNASTIVRVDGNGVFTNNFTNVNDTVGEFRFKHPNLATNYATVRFQRLVMNGGQLDNGDNGPVDILGRVDILANTPILANNVAGQNRPFKIDAFLTGTASIEYHDYDNSLNSAGGLNVAGATNTYSGTWHVVQGMLLGSGANSLGTNSITVDNGGGLETLYDLNTPAANLVMNGQMFLHQNDTVLTLTVAGSPVPPGFYTYAQLAGSYPANFPAAWQQQLGSGVAAASGSITVLAGPPINPIAMSVTTSQGTNLVFSGTNGIPNGHYKVQTTTNLALPITWAPVATYQFDGSGNFSFTNAINSAAPKQFFRLIQQVP